MKNFLLTLALLGGVAFGANAQSCTTDTTGLSQPGYLPSTLPNPKVGKTYNQQINFHWPSTDVSTGTSANVDSVWIDSVTQIPPGLAWACNYTACAYKGGEYACGKFTGTPSLAGNYNIVVYGRAKVSAFGITVPVFQNDTFPITVDMAGSISSVLGAGMKVYPNPSRDQFMVSALTGMETLELVTITGQVIGTIRANGQTTTTFGTAGVAPGVYVVRIRNASVVTTQRVVVQ